MQYGCNNLQFADEKAHKQEVMNNSKCIMFTLFDFMVITQYPWQYNKGILLDYVRAFMETA